MTTSLLPRTLLRTWPTTSSSGEDQNFSFSIISSPQFSLISWLCKFRSHYCIKYQTNEIMSKGCIFPWSFIIPDYMDSNMYVTLHLMHHTPGTSYTSDEYWRNVFQVCFPDSSRVRGEDHPGHLHHAQHDSVPHDCHAGPFVLINF